MYENDLIFIAFIQYCKKGINVQALVSKKGIFLSKFSPFKRVPFETARTQMRYKKVWECTPRALHACGCSVVLT